MQEQTWSSVRLWAADARTKHPHKAPPQSRSKLGAMPRFLSCPQPLLPWRPRSACLHRTSFVSAGAGVLTAISSLGDKKLIEEGENLLSAEYRAWADRMANPGPSAEPQR